MANCFSTNQKLLATLPDLSLIVACFLYLSFQCNALPKAWCAVGMRLRGRDLQDSPVSWIPNILGVQSVRLRLRLDRRDNKGRGCWQLVDLGSGSEQSCRKLRDRTPPTLSQSKTAGSFLTVDVCKYEFYITLGLGGIKMSLLTKSSI